MCVYASLVKIPEGQLPLPPRITPGWGVSGVLMICTGIIYALVGIKAPRVHVFFSAAYLASLGTAVLILYVTEPPIPLGVQGGYVAAAAFTGILLGAVATFFKEVTEVFGCLLGGFCLSMWLLCLRPGGLLHQTATRIILISCSVLGIPALYFVRYIRSYVLIGSISFSGATVTVLGIDCFSRAGLKEFWAYLWDLNDDLFPLGTETYPVTRGIRVQLAAIVLLTAAGVFSQIRLWRIIRRQNAERDAELAREQRDLEEEEENIGRRIQEQTDKERQLWEKRYGDDTKPDANSSGSVVFIENVPDDKKSNGSVHSAGSNTARSITKAETADGNEAPPSPGGTTTQVVNDPGPGPLIENDKDGGVVTVRVAADDTLPAMPPGYFNPDPEEQVVGGESQDQDQEQERYKEQGPDQDQGTTVNEAPPKSPPNDHSLQEDIAPCPPAVVPLPFKVPTANENAELAPEDDRSSVATYASKGDDNPVVTNERQPPAGGISEDARNHPSQTSHMSTHSGVHEDGVGPGQLVVHPALPDQDVDNRSVAATLDTESLLGAEDFESGASRRNTSDFDAERHPGKAADQEADSGVEPQTTPASQAENQQQQPPMPSDKDAGDVSRAEPEATDRLDASESSGTIRPEGTRGDGHVNAPVKRADMEVAADASCQSSRPAEPSVPGPKNPRSAASNESTPLSLTTDRLPHALSRVAISYRTNEWAKHLSHADLPEPERIQVAHLQQPPPVEDATGGEGVDDGVKEEAPAPLNVEDLQQTGESCASPPHSPTVGSKTKMRVSSTGSADPLLRGQNTAAMTWNTSSGAIPTVEKRGTSRMVSSTRPFRSEHPGQAVGNADPPSPVEAAGPESMARRFSEQTLIGRRETLLLQKKSNLYLPGSAAVPHPYAPPTRTPSEAGSAYNQPTFPAPGSPSAIPVDDDMPLSQRKEVIRQHSLLRNVSAPGPPPPGGVVYPHHHEGAAVTSTEYLPMDRRHASAQSLPVREVHPPAARRQSDFYTGAVAPVPFLGGFEQRVGITGRELEMQQSIDAQRRLLSLKDVEAQRRERERMARMMDERAFTARMQSGDLLEAHRDTLRRMQKQVNDKEA